MLMREAESIARTLGADRIRPPNAIEKDAARLIVEPQDAREIAELVSACETDRITVAPIGAARTLSQMRKEPVQIGISLRRMNHILAYEPEDMTVVAEAGLTVGDLNATVASRGQRLPVDPRNPDATTLGSLIGAGAAGPIRLSEGTVRDLLIGIQFVGHDGHLIRGGGRVVKNVAGYDLMKVLTGSFGTLGIVTEAAFKVRPIPENYTIARASFADLDAAFAGAMALHDKLPLIHLEILSPGVGAVISEDDHFVVLAGFAGIPSELTHQRDLIAQLLDGSTVIDSESAHELYMAVRDFDFRDSSLAARVAVLPAELSRCLRDSSADFVAHVGSGIAELWTETIDAALMARWREIAHSARGHLRVLSAPSSIRSQIDFFDRPNPGAFKLMQRLKSAFDPANVFNPGSFVGGV
jgi:glycolate oxidase FAD binding subunit